MNNILVAMILIAIAFAFASKGNAKGKPISAAQLKDSNGKTVGRVIGR
jgi:hypothetical protein